MLRSSALLLLASGSVRADGPGDGTSKSTYACNDPSAGLAFNLKYFPVTSAEDSCADNVCTCTTTSNEDAGTWYIQQGRVQLKKTSSSTELEGPTQSEGFGLHLVNVSQHLTTSGLSVAEVEGHFDDRLGDMSAFDAFMDFSIVLQTSDLDGYVSAFDADGVDYLSTTWSQPSGGDDYYGVLVRVPESQMVLELVSSSSAILSSPERAETLVTLEQRVTDRALEQTGFLAGDGNATLADYSGGDVLSAVGVGRACDKSHLDALDSFYGGLGVSTTASYDDVEGVSKRCYLWPGATADICYTARDDDAGGSADFTPKAFADMLNSVHAELLSGRPLCGQDKWLDNHYAVDLRSGYSGDTVVDYIESNPDTYYYCSSSSTPHYLIDPVGWGIQLDFQFSTGSSICKNSASFSPSGNGNLRGSGGVAEALAFFSEEEAATVGRRRLLQGGGNPACNVGTC